MINQSSNDVIVHITFEPVSVRFAGVERKVFRPGVRGFCFAEFDDGDVHPISHPLEEWFLGLVNRSAGVGTIYFEIDNPGERGNDGQDLSSASVTNMHSDI